MKHIKAYNIVRLCVPLPHFPLLSPSLALSLSAWSRKVSSGSHTRCQHGMTFWDALCNSTIGLPISQRPTCGSYLSVRSLKQRGMLLLLLKCLSNMYPFFPCAPLLFPHYPGSAFIISLTIYPVTISYIHTYFWLVLTFFFACYKYPRVHLQ